MYTVFSGSPEYIRHDLNMDKGKLIREAAKKVLNGQFFYIFFSFLSFIFFFTLDNLSTYGNITLKFVGRGICTGLLQ